jgi:hypothetical protein
LDAGSTVAGSTVAGSIVVAVFPVLDVPPDVELVAFEPVPLAAGSFLAPMKNIASRPTRSPSAAKASALGRAIEFGASECRRDVTLWC